jgi:hypothetical protein
MRSELDEARARDDNEHRMHSVVIIRRSMLWNDCAVDSPACLLARPLITTIISLRVWARAGQQRARERIFAVVPPRYMEILHQPSSLVRCCFTCPIRCHFRRALHTHTRLKSSLSHGIRFSCVPFVPAAIVAVVLLSLFVSTTTPPPSPPARCALSLPLLLLLSLFLFLFPLSAALLYSPIATARLARVAV